MYCTQAIRDFTPTKGESAPSCLEAQTWRRPPGWRLPRTEQSHRHRPCPSPSAAASPPVLDREAVMPSARSLEADSHAWLRGAVCTCREMKVVMPCSSNCCICASPC